MISNSPHAASKCPSSENVQNTFCIFTENTFPKYGSPGNLKLLKDHIMLKQKRQTIQPCYFSFEHIYISLQNSWHYVRPRTLVRHLPKSILGNPPVSLAVFGLQEIKRIYETWQIPVCKKWATPISASSLTE